MASRAGSAWTGHLSKWEVILARLVLIFHGIEQADRGQIDTFQPIDSATVERAVKFGGFSCAMRFTSTKLSSAKREATEARWLAGYLLLVHKWHGLRPGKSVRPGTTCATSASASAQCAISRPWDGPRSVPGGRADSRAWEINPEIHLRFSAQAEREARVRADRYAAIQEARVERRRMAAREDAEDG